MTHQPRAAVVKLLPGKRRHQRGQFRVDRLFDQLTGAAPKDGRERVRAKSRWIRQLGDGILRHVAYPFLG